MASAVVAVALSGGVDSLVAAHLLREKGHHLLGLHFVTGFETAGEAQGERAPGDIVAAARRRMARVGGQLGIDVEIVDLSRAFRRKVVDYFVETYAAGRTPSPCLVCNPRIKFGRLLSHARQRGADRLATGHYARVIKGADGRMHLYRGRDAGKDQSYFLARLSGFRLERALFPLGEMTKNAVKELARRRGLSPVASQESQDVCFIRGEGYAAFLARLGLAGEKGPIVTVDGRVIGEHRGLQRFTIGQRRGIDCPAPEPYYVVRIDVRRNRLVVGGRQDLYVPGCRVTDINWIAGPPGRAFDCTVKIRYRHRAVSCRVTPQGPDAAMVLFRSPQAAVTPGQAAVFYADEEVLGSGWIASPEGDAAET